MNAASAKYFAVRRYRIRCTNSVYHTVSEDDRRSSVAHFRCNKLVKNCWQCPVLPATFPVLVHKFDYSVELIESPEKVGPSCR